jgi:hypothetical protein
MTKGNNRLGDGPIQRDLYHVMSGLAQAIDDLLNGEVGGKKNGFILMVFPFDHGGRCNYISNAAREDVVILLKEQLARFEGQPEMEGHA